ncbi:MAG TPA: hypothetical protein VFY40_11680 [Blastocatellia bacterium]|nr:hypothetical protein [Blastocatellia bacterium]
MKTSPKLTQALLGIFALAAISMSALAQTPRGPLNGPGAVPPLLSAQSEAGDHKAGSLLFFNYYTSGVADSAGQNTRINITNTNNTAPVSVHLFFVNADDSGVADSFICLAPNQTASFLASDVDPGTTGYIIAVASDDAGRPVVFNHLIGDEYVKMTTGHAANLGAEAFTALGPAGALVGCDFNSTLAVLNFNGAVGGYNRAPRVLALDSFSCPADGADTLLIINRIGGDMTSAGAEIGSLTGLVYDDSGASGSFSFTTDRSQFQGSVTSSFPRTTPQISSLVPSGRSGWLKFSSQADNAYLGAVIVMNANQDDLRAFNGGHNLHKLALAANAQITIPIFPPDCLWQFDGAGLR